MEEAKTMRDNAENDTGRVDVPGLGLRPVPQLKVDEVTVDFDREKPENSLISDEERQKHQISD